MFNKSRTTLIQYPGGLAGAYTIPNSVTSIGTEAFFACPRLTSVTIPNSVASIKRGAFGSGTGLTGVYYQGNAPSFDSYVFDHADKATFHYLPGTTGWWGPTVGGRPTAIDNRLPTPGK